MKLQLKVALAFLIALIWIQQGLCDELSAKSGINNWTCTCSASYQGNQIYIKSKCSTSCDCSPGMLLLIMLVDKVEVRGHVHVLLMGYQKLPLAFKILPVLQPATALLEQMSSEVGHTVLPLVFTPQWIHHRRRRRRHRRLLFHCLIHHTMKEDGWIHVYGFCVAVAYSHAAALHSLSLRHLLPKAAFL